MSGPAFGILRCISPIDGRVYVERPLLAEREVAAALARARVAQRGWAKTPLRERQATAERAVDAMLERRDAVAEEITRQMGRPIAQSPGELRGFEERARHMIAIAGESLADVVPEPKPGFRRFIRREPLGVVFVVAPWNYPYLTAVNAVVPALLAGNAVLLKHSSQTPLCAERFEEVFAAAGLPAGLLQALHLSHESTLGLVASEGVDFVAFTGSVAGGHAIVRAAAGRFLATGLELGGKDPAYVASDADLVAAAEGLVDGAFFNAGQSCCGIERIYVHERVYDQFLANAVEATLALRLGDPSDPATTLGPMVRTGAADLVREHTAEALSRGARALIDEDRFAAAAPGTPYLAPQILVDVDHSMRIMTEETFGPVVGVMRVASDEQAVALMNDSRYGLTAAIYTLDAERALSMGRELETGTVYMNRCDYLDPGLAWTGVKDSGRGVTLSKLGYEVLTRAKSFHLRVG